MTPTKLANDNESHSLLKPPVDLSHHLSSTARRRKANVYKLFYKYYDIEGIQDISGGLPHPSLFPVEKMSGLATRPDHLAAKGASDLSISTSQDDIEIGLQYGQVTGYPAFQNWIDDLMKNHMATARYEGGFSTLLTTGSTDGWCKVLQVLSNEWQDDDPIEKKEGLLVEEFTYSCAVEAARVRGLNICSIEVDSQGLIPESLENILANWDVSRGRKPHILYTISIGQNPTGATVPRQRRQKIYDICCKYDVVIVEDEPYWFMQYEGNEKCYLDVDTEGRVLRLDSFSKTFTPGCRVGWITGQPDLISRVYYLAEEATQQPSGFSQVIMYRILNEWGVKGWLRWLESLRDEYKIRRDLMIEGLKEHEPFTADGKRIFDFKPPQAGMFVWIKVNYDLHPHADVFSTEELSQALWMWGTKNPRPYLVNPGYMFAPVVDNAAHMASFFRVSFAPCEKSTIEPAAASTGLAAQEFWKMNPNEIAALVKEYPTD